MDTLLDSNLIIYASRPEQSALRAFIAREVPCVSVISKVETLGYHELSEDGQQFLKEFFQAAEVLSVSKSIVAEAISLRQQHSMSLGDSLIAGMALSQDLRLSTHNTEEFAWVDDLEVIDPIASEQ